MDVFEGIPKKELRRLLANADASSRNLFEWMLWNTDLTPTEICEISNRPRP